MYPPLVTSVLCGINHDPNKADNGGCAKLTECPLPFFGLLVCLNLSAFILAGYQSFKSRHLPSVFNESFYMTVTICVILEAFLIGLPILVVVNVNNIAFMVIGSWIITIAALAVLFPMFWPKIVGGRVITAMHLSSRGLWQENATLFTSTSNMRSAHVFNT